MGIYHEIVWVQSVSFTGCPYKDCLNTVFPAFSTSVFLSILQALNILYTQKSQDWMKAIVSHDSPLPQPWIISVFLVATVCCGRKIHSYWADLKLLSMFLSHFAVGSSQQWWCWSMDEVATRWPQKYLYAWVLFDTGGLFSLRLSTFRVSGSPCLISQDT